MSTPRILATEKASALIIKLKQYHDGLVFYLQGSFNEEATPRCFKSRGTKPDPNDLFLGKLEGCRFFVRREQFDSRLNNQLILDIAPGRGISFSLEAPLGQRFLIRSRNHSRKVLPELGLVP